MSLPLQTSHELRHSTTRLLGGEGRGGEGRGGEGRGWKGRGMGGEGRGGEGRERITDCDNTYCNSCVEHKKQNWVGVASLTNILQSHDLKLSLQYADVGLGRDGRR